jgi:hypothetical protein
MRHRFFLGFAASLCLIMPARRADAQFTTIINVPPDALPDQIESNTQINVLPGGEIPDWYAFPTPSLDVMDFEVNVDGGVVGSGVQVPERSVTHIRSGEVGPQFRAESESIVSIYGGILGSNFTAEGGSEVTVGGGIIVSHFRAESGSNVLVSGGAFGDLFRPHPQSNTTLSGADFLVNGLPVAGLNELGDTVRIDLPNGSGSTISGTFGDGTPFVLATDESDWLSLTLRLASIPEPGPPVLDAAMLNAEMQPLPLGIRTGQTLLVGPGGSVPINFSSGAGGTIVVSGGTVGGNLEVLDSNVELHSGTIGGGFDAFGTSNVVMAGGSLSGSMDLYRDSHLELSGGIWAGAIRSQPGSSIDIYGGEFYLNNTAVTGLDEIGSRHQLDWTEDDIVSGVLADGTLFVLPHQEGAVTLESVALPTIGPDVVNAATDPIPSGLRAGQTLIVDGGAIIPENFRAGRGSVVEVRDGRFRRGFEAIGADVHFQGGIVEGALAAIGARVDVDGGEEPLEVSGSHGAEISVNGGALAVLELQSGSTGEFRGGRVGGVRVLGTDSTLRLIGGDFRLNGELIEGFENDGDSLAIDLPDHGTITGTLSDGSPFALLSADQFADDYILPGGLVLEKAPLPPPDPRVISAPMNAVPLVLKESQTLVVQDGAAIGTQFVAGRGSTIELQGGSIDRFLRVAGATVNVQDGQIDAYFDALDGTTVNVTGGTITHDMSLLTGSVLNVARGLVWSGLDAFEGTTVNMSGGEMHGLDVWDGAVFNMTGGVLRFRTNALPGGTINLSGGESRGSVFLAPDTVLNLSGGSHEIISSQGVVNVTGDVHIDSLGISQNEFVGTAGELFMAGGSLEANRPHPSARPRVQVGGTAHISGGRIGTNFDLFFTPEGKGFISGGMISGKLVAFSRSDVEIQGTSLRFDGELVSGALRPGDRLDLGFDQASVISGTLADGTPFIYSTHNGDEIYPQTVQFELVERMADRPSLVELPQDPVPLGAGTGETVTVGAGADVYSGFLAGWDSTLAVTGGTVGDRMRASGSRVVVESGSIGDTFHAYHGTTVELYGGSIGDDFSAFEDSTVIVRGGSIGEGFHAYPSASVHWYGGDLGETFLVDDDSTLHVYGTDFHLDEQPLDLTLGETRQLTDTATLTATLADGSRPAISVGQIDENRGSALSVAITRVSTIPGDFNNNGLVEQSDLDQVLVHWGQRLDRPWNDGWINNLPIGHIDQNELDRVLVNWGRTILPGLPAHAVPEPTTMATLCVLVLGLTAIGIRRRGCTCI